MDESQAEPITASVAEPPVVETPPVVERQDSQGATPGKRAGLRYLIDSRGMMLLLLFGATAALGLPLLWKSNGFSQREKILWSIVVTIYTLIIFWLFFLVMQWCYNQIAGVVQ